MGGRPGEAVVKRERWATRFGFIMATVGFSVGLGNIWRFPYLTGENGGGAFLMIYLGLAVLIGIPLFTAEISLGRRTRLTPIAGMRTLTRRPTSPWNLIGWFGLLAALLIMSYYQLIMGWIVAYLFKFAGGAFAGADPAEVQAAFDTLVADPFQVLLYGALMLLLIGIVVNRGLRRGLERVAKVLLPTLFFLLVVLAIGGLMQPGAWAGVRWYLAPDFGAITPVVILAALGQVFFSVGVGMAAAFVYGSYLDPQASDVPGGAVLIVGFDVLAAVLAGFAIFPALFAFGLSPEVGPGLLFIAMTNVFAQAPAGSLAGTAFFFLLLIAGLTSGIALVEALTASAMDSLGASRSQAAWTTLGVILVLGIPSALAFGPWAHVQVAGLDIFGLIDFIASNILLTAGGLLIALYTTLAWGFDRFQQETNVGAGRIRVLDAWRPFVRFLIPAAVALVLLASVGVI